MEKIQSADSAKSIAFVLIKFSLPLILSGILQQLYNWADAFIVGNVEGEGALAAIGATTTLVNFYVTAITGFTLGLSILFAQKYGSGDEKEIAGILSTFSVFLGGIFTVFAATGIAAALPLLELLNTTADTILLAKDYLQLVFIGVPFLAVYNVYSAALRGIGDSKAPFYAVLLSSAINIALDILFVACFRWGVSGAAIATVISQSAMTVFLVAYGVKKYSVLRFKVCRQSFNKKSFTAGCRFGVPPMLQSSVNSAGNIILQNFMNGFGTQTVAAITTAYRVDSIILVPMINLGSGISTLVAQSVGSGQKKHARKILSVGAVLMSVISLLMTGLVISIGGHLIALFGAGQEAISIGDNFFHRIAVFYLVYGLSTAVRGYLEGTGDVLYSSFTGIAALCFRILASYAFVSMFSNMVIAYAEGFSWIILLLLYTLRLIWKEKSKKEVEGN